MTKKQLYRPADDGPGINRLRSNKEFERIRLDTLEQQQRALRAARLPEGKKEKQS